MNNSQKNMTRDQSSFLLKSVKYVVKEALTSWRASFVGKKRKNTWKFIPLCIFWTIWKERKRIAFQDGILAVQRLKCNFDYNLWSWNRIYSGDEASSIVLMEWLASS